jgi:predicted N-formylglutamate amidohydrolase
MNLTKEQRDFLQRVRDGQPLSLADRREDRVRQYCRRNGLASVLMKPRRWVITTAGRTALEKERGE